MLRVDPDRLTYTCLADLPTAAESTLGRTRHRGLRDIGTNRQPPRNTGARLSRGRLLSGPPAGAAVLALGGNHVQGVEHPGRLTDVRPVVKGHRGY